jgi:DNA replication protein DnaC
VVITLYRFWSWGNTFDVDISLATATIDRLMHHWEANLIEGDSYRTANSNR